MAKVRVIPSTINPVTLNPIGTFTKKRVAAYARVSTDSDEQYTSYEAQVNYYSKKIKENSEYEFVKVYADEGITGTNTKKRDSFNQMIADALDGKIDLIITKSISRFARNTLDTISITRKLKAKGIEVYFEKENLWTLDSKSELILTIMSSIAQEESRSISQNVTVGKRWGMREGKVSFAYRTFLGYKKVEDKIVIDEAQAEIVKRIYRMFLIEGKTCTGIAEALKKEGILTPSQKGTNWTKNTVNSILTNEKYKGDALLQKTFISDYLEHTVKKNKGQIPQYYVENSHPAIIDRDTWERVQVEMERRVKIGAKYSGNNIFASKLICEDCGGFYGPKTWHKGSKYEKVIFQCNRKFDKDKDKCHTPNFTEDEIKNLFIKAYNLAMEDKDRVIKDTEDIIELLTDTTEVEKLIAGYQEDMEVVREAVNSLIKDNSRRAQSQEQYETKYNKMVKKYEALSAKLDEVLKIKSDKEDKRLRLSTFLNEVKSSKKFITDWSDEIWMLMVEKAIVHKDGTITFIFFNGKEVRV